MAVGRSALDRDAVANENTWVRILQLAVARRPHWISTNRPCIGSSLGRNRVGYCEVVSAVDVVIVSYRSRARLAGCVGSLIGHDDIAVTVVDNASPDNSLDVVAGLPVNSIGLKQNFGFAYACNRGAEAGDAASILFLNPDAHAEAPAVRAMERLLADDSSLGAVAPRVVRADRTLDFSQRRFPSPARTYARAVFLQRAFPRRAWSDEVIRDETAYERAGFPDWVSGACILARRSAFEGVGGFDEGFLMYSEDADLCRRLRDAGFRVRFAPDATVMHEGGASGPRPDLLPLLASSRVRYAEKHHGTRGAKLERAGLVLESTVRVAVSRGGLSGRTGHLRAIATLLGWREAALPQASLGSHPA